MIRDSLNIIFITALACSTQVQRVRSRAPAAILAQMLLLTLMIGCTAAVFAAVEAQVRPSFGCFRVDTF